MNTNYSITPFIQKKFKLKEELIFSIQLKNNVRNRIARSQSNQKFDNPRPSMDTNLL